MQNRSHELANAAAIVQACFDFLAAHPTRRGDAVDAAITDARVALETIRRIAHEVVEEKVRESLPGSKP